MLDKKRKREKKNEKPVTSSHTIKCFGIKQLLERVRTRILLSLRMRLVHALWAADMRCPFMRSSPDSQALASHPLAAQGPHRVKHSTKMWLKLEWKDTRAVWYGSGGAFLFFIFLPMRSLRQSAIRNIRYACVAAGYFTGLETSIISQQPFDFKHVPVKPPSGDAVQCRNASVAGPFNQKIPQSDVLPFPPPPSP